MTAWIITLPKIVRFAYAASYITVWVFAYHYYIGLVDTAESPMLGYFLGMGYRLTLLLIVISVAHFLSRAEK